MKTLAVTLLMILSQSVFAASNDRTFVVKNITNENGEQVFVSYGHMTISQDKISLKVFGEQICGVPEVGALTVPCFASEIINEELEIDESTLTTCGDMYVADRNMMPADGVHTNLVVEDYSQVLCKMFFPHAATATVTRKFYNRFTAEVITQVYTIEFARAFTK